MNKFSIKEILKPVFVILWSIIDLLMFLAGVYDSFDSYAFIMAIIVWLIVLLLILKTIEKIDSN